jgi:hypothetical protein
MSGGSCLVVQWLPRTFRYYPEGIPKSSVCLHVQFAERMFGGPPSNVRTTDSSVHLLDLAYVRLKSKLPL